MTNKTNNLPKIFTPSVLAVLFMVLSGIFATSMHCLICRKGTGELEKLVPFFI